MSGFPGSPRLVKGALVGLDVVNPLARVIVFQYNPDSFSRQLRAAAADGGAEGEQLRLKGAPEETITLEVEIDATDLLEVGDPVATSLGVAPTLASLELMVSPRTVDVITRAALAGVGMVEVVPAVAPLTLLVWGPARVLPVRVTDLSITEEAFDPMLNPIRAKASISMRVLTYDDLGLLSAGGALSLAQLATKEAMATINTVSSVGSFSATASLGTS